MVVIQSLMFAPVMNCLCRTPFVAGKTHLAMVLPNRLLFDYFDILGGADLCANGTAIAFLVDINALIGQRDHFIIF
jgi:hypothetical protein